MLAASALVELLRDLRPRVLSALVRQHRDLAACEDALQDATLAAADQWPRSGVPDQPHAWLIHVAKRRLTDARRSDEARTARELEFTDADARGLSADEALAAAHDDSLDLFFLCCQPALSPASAVALTLRTIGGLTTAELARAWLVPEATMGQRLSRARQTLETEGVQLGALDEATRRARLPLVMQVLYLAFNEGYAASSGAEVSRVDLATEAIRLTRLLLRLMPDEPEVLGLLALMLLTDARRAARTGPDGELVPLDEQDRARWHRGFIDEGTRLVERAFARGAVGPYQVQAAIAALHDGATHTDVTDWAQIAGLYEVLLRFGDNPMVRLNLAIARAMLEGPERGLSLLDELEALRDHHRWVSARAHLLERAGRHAEAIDAFTRASELTASLAEKNFLLLRAARLRVCAPTETT